MSSVEKYKKVRTVYLLLGLICMMLLGLVYAWSIFADGLAQLSGGNASDLSSVFGLMMIFFCAGCLSASVMQNKVGVRVTIFLSAVSVCIGFCVTALTAAYSVLFIYLFYGIFTGFGCGLGYNTMVSTVNQWYPGKVGFSSGVLLLGFGSGALIFGMLAQAMINSALGCGNTLIIIGLVLTVVVIIGSFVIKKPTVEQVRALSEHVESTSTAPSQSFTPKEMLTSRIFLIQVFWYISVTLVSIVLLGSVKQGAVEVGVSASIAALLVGLTSTVNGVSRVLYGIAHDKFGLLFVMRIISILSLTGVVLLSASLVCSIPALYIIGALVVGISYGGVTVCCSTFPLVRFGKRHYPTNFAICTSCLMPTSALQMLVMPLLLSSIGRTGQYCVLCVLSAAGIFFFLLFSRQFKQDMRKLSEN